MLHVHRPLFQIKRSLQEFKSSSQKLSDQADCVKKILVAQEANRIALDADELVMLRKLIEHFAIISKSTSPGMIYDHIPENIIDDSLDGNAIAIILNNINTQLKQKNLNKEFSAFAASCRWVANNYENICKLNAKLLLDDEQKLVMRDGLIAPLQRLPRLKLFSNTWVEQAKEIGNELLQITANSLSSKFGRLVKALDQGVDYKEIQAFKLWFDLKSPAEQLADSVILVGAETAALLEQSVIRPQAQTIEDLQNSLIISDEVASDDHVQETTGMEKLGFYSNAKNILTSLIDVNSYLSLRAKETRRCGFLAFFGYSGQDYYDRRSDWKNLLSKLVELSADGSVADVGQVLGALNASIAKFSGRFSRTNYADKLKVLVESISANPADLQKVLQLPRVSKYIDDSMSAYGQLDELSRGMVSMYKHESPEFLTVVEAQETEEINRASGRLK